MLSLAELYDPIAEPLQRARQLFDDELASDVPFVEELCGHVSALRGKMLRPAILLLAGRAARQLTDEHVTLAAVVELVHMATLVHDDVLDNGQVRRRSMTLNRRYGNEGAVLLGDYLISHAFHLCSRLDSQYASRLIGATTNTICEGELMQVCRRGQYGLSQAEYLDIISRKSASLISCCCVLGARYAGADARTVWRLERYGTDVGMAFQIVDDILDIVGSEHQTGKTLGRDLAKGKATLPLIHFLATAPAARRNEALEVLNNGRLNRTDRVRELIASTNSIDCSMQVARRYVDSALDSLCDLAPSRAKDSLVSMAEFILQRQQ